MARAETAGAETGAIPHGADPIVVLRYARLVGDSDPAERDRALEFAAARAGDLPPPAQLTLFQQAETAGRHDLIAPALAALAEAPALPHGVAVALLRRAVMAEPPVAPLVAALAGRVPSAQAGLFAVDAASITRGPEAALAAARATRGPRAPAAVAQLARLLLDCGHAPLARRYLSRAVARWPGQSGLAGVFVAACIAADEVGIAEAWLDRAATALGRRRVHDLQVELLGQTGRSEAAVARMLDGTGTPRPEQVFRAALRLGRTDLAEAQARKMVGAGTGSRRRAVHFAATHLGAMLNEARLAAIAHAAGTPEAERVARFVQPAIATIDRLAPDPDARLPGRHARDDPARIPHRVLQYWDSGAPPTEIAAVIGSWQRHPGWDHLLLDRASARACLHDRLGARYVRAFDLANHVAEECDFLRLCLLLADGGVYADADDKCLTDPGGLTAMAGDTGLLLFREPHGAVMNNLIAASPGHPMLERAVHMACRSLLARENDSTWSKTGPGLLVRALAVHLSAARADGRDPDLVLLPMRRVGRAVKPHMRLPYKQTGAYWQATGDPVSAALRDGLARLTGGTDAPAG